MTKRRYDDLVGNSVAHSDSNATSHQTDYSRTYTTGTQSGDEKASKYTGFYEQVMRKKREAQKIFEQQKPIDLDFELQKLEKIKEMRRNEFEERRDQAQKERLKQMTSMYFEAEKNKMAHNQARGVSQVKKKVTPKIYYTRDFKNIKEIADHRLNHRFDYDGSKK